jgi:hypothetical protein
MRSILLLSLGALALAGAGWLIARLVALLF